MEIEIGLKEKKNDERMRKLKEELAIASIIARRDQSRIHLIFQ